MARERTAGYVDDQTPPRFVPSTRFTLALLVFFAFVVQYSQRVNLPIAIVCMVNRTVPSNHRVRLAGTMENPSDRVPNNIVDSSKGIQSGNIQIINGLFEKKQFFWNEEQQQDLLGGYWAGYIFTQVPGDYIDVFFPIALILLSLHLCH